MITVLAGVNGAGKSLIGGSALRAANQDWYNPDEFAQVMRAQYPDKPIKEINSQVWHEGRCRLKASKSVSGTAAWNPPNCISGE